jgi:hypothetical protein
MRVRNAVWRPRFVMYYRTWPLSAVRGDLTAAGFTMTTVPLTALGRRVVRSVEIGFRCSLDGLGIKIAWWYAGPEQIALRRSPRTRAGPGRASRRGRGERARVEPLIEQPGPAPAAR